MFGYIRLYESHPLLYRGGFALITLATLIVIPVVTHPHAVLMPSLLSVQPLCWIGVRSYGIHLWHWPIFMLTQLMVDVSLSSWQLFCYGLS